MTGQILLVFAFVFAVISALFVTNVQHPPISVHFGWLAVAFYILAGLMGAFGLK